MRIESNEKAFLKNRKNEKLNSKRNIFIFFRFSIIIFFILFLFKKHLLLNQNRIINYKKLDKGANNNILDYYIKQQKDFCSNFNKHINQKFEKEIFLIDAKINELKFQIYIFKSPNFVLGDFVKYGAYEVSVSNNILEALKFYASNKNIFNNKDIVMLDIGTNIGWYPSFLGRYEYTILCFEAFEKNYYVAKKNYCHLNKDSNVIIISKGLGSKEKICQYFTNLNNEGNGMVICDNNKTKFKDKTLGKAFIKNSDVEITTLKKFFPYFSTKNIALIKIDIEGYEFEVLKGGKELIIEYHVPYIMLEFSPSFLREVGSDPKELALFFVNNGYKISLNGFLSKKFITVEELLHKAGFQINCYFIHNSMI